MIHYIQLDKMNPSYLANHIFMKHCGNILHDGKSFLMFDNGSKLWQRDQIYLEQFVDDIPVKYKYIINLVSFREKVLKELYQLCYDKSKIELMDSQHHLLPIVDGMIIDTSEKSIRDRVKEDYFTSVTNLQYLDNGDLSDAVKYFKSIVKTDTEYHNMIRILGELLFGQTFDTKSVIIAGGPSSGKSILCSIMCGIVDNCAVINIPLLNNIRMTHTDMTDFIPSSMMQITGTDNFYKSTMKSKFRTVIQIDIDNIYKYDPNKWEIIILNNVFEPTEDNHTYIKYIRRDCKDQIFTLLVNAAIGFNDNNRSLIEIEI